MASIIQSADPGRWAGFIAVICAAIVGWIARHTIKRVDELEKNALTRDEFAAFCESRERADEDRSKAIVRLERKIDEYHKDVTQRMDRFMDKRNDDR